MYFSYHMTKYFNNLFRSKHSLLDIAMVEIESSFKPPDVSEDLYQPSGDDDWHKWLAELMMDDKSKFFMMCIMFFVFLNF